jgi:hypothetical protein
MCTRLRLLAGVTLVALVAAQASIAQSGSVFFSSGNLQGARDHTYKPSIIAFGSNSYIVGLRWTGWNRPVAHAHGTLELNDCRPDCAAGTVTPEPVKPDETLRVRI